MSVFERYKKARKELKITQGAIAEANGVSQSALSQKEAGGNISIKTLEFIRKTYNINLNWLFDGEGEMISKEGVNTEIESIKEEKRALERTLLSLTEQLSYYLKRETDDNNNSKVGS